MRQWSPLSWVSFLAALALVLLSVLTLWFYSYDLEQADVSPVSLSQTYSDKSRESLSSLNGRSSSTNINLIANEFQLVTHRDESRIETSVAHCTMSTMNDLAWQGAVCSYKQLCYDPRLEKFVFYQGAPEVATPSEVNLGKKTRFYPEISLSELPIPRYESNSEFTWVLMEMNRESVSNLEAFLRDDLFAWWLLSQHSAWPDDITSIRPLASALSPPLSDEMLAWYDTMPFSYLLNVKDFRSLRYPVCFAKSVVGLGSMTDHCFADDHDFKLKKLVDNKADAIPCAIGRGPLFYRLREEMIQRLLGISSVEQGKKRNPSESAVILFAEESPTSERFSTLETVAQGHFPSAVVKRVCTACLSPKQQAELALTVSVFVTSPDGPQSVLGHFLRRGAGIVLVEKPPFTHRNFGYWNNLGYVRTRWAQSESNVIQSIRIELDKSTEFM